jgi:hypothetical protein
MDIFHHADFKPVVAFQDLYSVSNVIIVKIAGFDLQWILALRSFMVKISLEINLGFIITF